MTHKRTSDWYFPWDWLFILFFIPGLALFAGISMPLMARMASIHPMKLLIASYVTGLSGAFLLFLARLPLYRRRRFWTWGPGGLDRVHRSLYYVAYAVIAVFMMLVLVFWLRVR